MLAIGLDWAWGLVELDGMNNTSRCRNECNARVFLKIPPKSFA